MKVIMLLKLKNFRCHRDATFKFPDSGLVLLSGISGSGKSTILKGIVYALYGKIQKPYSFGTNACSVYLEFMDMKITRTSRPNRLIVNEKYEDDAGQNYIEKRIGMTFEEFKMSSYIPQKTNESILSMTQMNQVNYLKMLAFNGNENEIHKEKMNKMIQETSERMIELRTQLKTYQKELEKIDEEMEPIEFPLYKDEDESEEESIERYRERMKTFNSRISKLIEEKEKMASQIQEYLLLKADMELYLDRKQRLLNELEDTQKRFKEINESIKKSYECDYEMEIQTYENLIEYVTLNNKITDIENQIEEIYKEESQEKKKEMMNIKKNLWLFHGEIKPKEEAEHEIEEYEKILDQWNDYCKKYEKFTEYKSNMIDIVNTLSKEDVDELKSIEICQEILMNIWRTQKRKKEELEYSKELLYKMKQQAEYEKELLQCPVCDTELQLKDKTLIQAKDVLHIEQKDYDSEIEEIKNEINTLNQKQDELLTLKHKFETIELIELENTDSNFYLDIQQKKEILQTFIEKNKQKEEHLQHIQQELETGDLSPALKALNKEIKTHKHQLGEIIVWFQEEGIRYKENTNSIDEMHVHKEKLKHEQDDMIQKKKEFQTLSQKLIDLENNKKEFDKTLSIIEEKMSGKNGDGLKKKIYDLEIEMNKTKRKQTEDELLLDKVEHYIEYCKLKKKYDYWNQKNQDVSERLDDIQKQHDANLLLKEKYIQAELMALNSTMESINEHTKHFLNTFFNDIPITAYLEIKNKNKKISHLKVNTYLNYKGNEYDSIQQLSGGELDRCNLASICGVNSMINSPVLILDESLASLDTDANTDILSFLKEMAGSKLILVCSHEAVRGIFDSVVELES